MSDSLPDMTAAPDQFAAGGRTYRVAPLSFGHLGSIQRWVNQQLPDPRQIARDMMQAGFPESACEKIALEAFRVARLGGVKINDPEAGRILASPEGVVQVLWHALKKHQPGITEADVVTLIDEIDPGEMERVQAFVFGNGDDDPKATGRGSQTRPTGGGSSSA